MGVVYKAHDTKLDRMVALKFLPPYLSSDAAEKERFYHEARAASALLHTNVAVIFEVNEFEGRIFLAMEYVEGQTLKSLIATGEPFSLKKFLDIAIQASEGIAAAHEKGIVHRDIKSDNIMITPKGQVKVMDFGLAKVKGATKLTKVGSTVGTAAYMSPEQAQGEDVDARSDIFSFGVVLYELLTGKLPFRGEHQAALMYSLINEDPPPIARFNEQAGPEIERIVLKALAKDREDRYQHADDLLADLRRERKQLEYARQGYVTSRTITAAAPAQKPAMKRKTLFLATGAVVLLIAVAVVVFWLKGTPSGGSLSGSSRKMLVVLPFENLGTLDQDYFADGLTEEVTSRLSGLSGLGVIARTSAMQYKKTTKSIQDIGRELGVQYVLQGTIRWGTTPDGGKRVRINPALINVSDGTQVWSQPYDAVFSDVFKLQSDISSQVAGALGMTLLQPERDQLEQHPTENPEAYDYYLRGSTYYRRSYEVQDIRFALDLFQKAVALDPDFALAYAKIAESHAEMYWFFFDHTPERLVKAKEAADHALQLNPRLAEAHISLGFYYYWGFLDYDNALKEFAIAQRSQPNNSLVLLAVGSVYRRQGKMEEATQSMIKAAEVDPRSSEVSYNLAQTYLLQRRFTDAEHEISRSITLAPDVLDRYAYKAFIMLAGFGDIAGAKSALSEASAVTAFAASRDIQRAQIQIALVEKNYATGLAILSSSIDDFTDNQFVYATRTEMMAELYDLMNDHEKARRAYDSARVTLERKVAQRPDDARYHSALGMVYAGLGRSDDALREGKRAVELMPISKEAWRGAYRVLDLAYIQMLVGQQDEAVTRLSELLSMPSEFTAAWLRLDPRWTPLKGNPRFQKLVQ